MPKKVVVIGAGPIGLYIAYLLKNKGADVVVYDPRAGERAEECEYTRPGHINESVFRAIEKGIQKQFWAGGKGHIKDIQRILHRFVIDQGTSIAKKKFVRFNNTTESQGIVVSDGTKDEFISCDHVFDVTGSARVLINQLNALNVQKPFTLKPISSEINVENHFLAYVKMTDGDLSRVNLNGSISFYLGWKGELEYANNMEKLRALGWNEFGIPLCYGVKFGKNKVCIYSELPENLSTGSQEEWVKLNLNINSGTQDITFAQIPDKPNKPKKPKFNAFKVVPSELVQVAHKEPGKPMVMVAGDAQIDPNYYLAHGITDGVSRANEMIGGIDCYNGGIAYFEPDEYSRSIKDLLKKHRDRIVTHYHERAQFFQTWLYKAEQHYTVAIQQVKGTAQEAVFQKTLNEIQARINYDKAQKLRASLYDATGKIAFSKVSLDTVATQLATLNTHLDEALNGLPVTFIKERQNALSLLKETANSYKDLGNEYFKKQTLAKAAVAYEQGLKIYQNPLLANKYPVEELTLYSNLIIILNKDNQNEKAILAAIHAIDSYPSSAIVIPAKQKIMHNLIKALTALKHSKYEATDDSYVLLLIEQAQQCVKDNPLLLKPELKLEFERLFYKQGNSEFSAKFITGVGPGFFNKILSLAPVNSVSPKIPVF